MKSIRHIVAIALATTLLCVSVGGVSHAGGIPVGSSSLIQTLDYSDSFTLTANGGEPGRVQAAYPIPASPQPSGLDIENTYGNPAQQWTQAAWSINSDTTTNDGQNHPGFFPIYPGGSGAGSATGDTETGYSNAGSPTYAVYGLSYGLHTNYVAQVDAVQTPDWVAVISSPSDSTISATNSLAVLFRADNNISSVPDIGLYNGTTETPVYNTPTGNFQVGATALSSGIATYGAGWNNYAVDFDHDNNTVSIYVNQSLLKTLDLTTFAGGIYESYSNAHISIAGSGQTTTYGILWTDNFQLGAAVVPEPSTVLLAGIGMLGLVGLAKRRRAVG